MSTILIVDDNPADQELCAIALERSGYTGGLEACSSASEALRLLADAAHGVSLLIVDLKMPGMTGTELLLRLPRETPPVVVLTSSNATKDRLAVEADPRVLAYLTKPPSAEQMRALLERLHEHVGFGGSPDA